MLNTPMNNLESSIKKINDDNNSSIGNTLENVLILQGGGSLGAFGCGVYKSLVKNNINLDIIAGTSIGGINAAIIAGSKNNEHTDELLENFWLELSDGFVDMDNLSFFSSWSNFMNKCNHFLNIIILQILSILSTAEAGIKENYSSNKNQMKAKLNK